jgi:serine/threonine protein kinase
MEYCPSGMQHPFGQKASVFTSKICCPTGSLADLMKMIRPKMLTEHQIAAICKDVLNGLVYLHQSKKVHRDIKPENIQNFYLIPTIPIHYC